MTAPSPLRSALECAAEATAQALDELHAAEFHHTWLTAWATGNHETLRAWFDTHVGYHGPLGGDHPGGTITTQDQADAMAGKRVTGTIRVRSGAITLHDCLLHSAAIDVTGGHLTIRNVTQDVALGTAAPGYFEVRGGTVDVHNMQIRNGQDGIRTWTPEALRARYLYVHSVSHDVESVGNGHQDGIQCAGGTLDVARSFIDYRDAVTSAVLLKPDSRSIPSARFAQTFLQGGNNTIHVHDSGTRAVGAVAFDDCMVAEGYRRALTSVWQVNAAVTQQMTDSVARVSTVDGGGLVSLRDAARIP